MTTGRPRSDPWTVSVHAAGDRALGSGVVIENCFSYVTINSTSNNVGGIVGSVASNATIRNCANYGNITGGSNVGGIIGGFTGSDNTVTGCYNTGVVTATGSNAGGVFGGRPRLRSGQVLSVHTPSTTYVAPGRISTAPQPIDGA